MSVHSVRLPDALWQCLVETLATINRDRRRPVNMSSLIRVLLEDRLDQDDRRIPFGNRIVRPSQNRKQKIADVQDGDVKSLTLDVSSLSNVEQTEPSSIYKQFQALVMRSHISSNAFLRMFPGERAVLTKFYSSGRVPVGQAGIDFLASILTWMGKFDQNK